MIVKALAFICSSLLVFGCGGSQGSVRTISDQQKSELVEYLRAHWKSPEDYLIEKFRDHDIVFIGEMHRVKHDVELIHNLIPRLYKIGVYNLGIEFGGNEYQDKVDSLVTADEYDENLARWLLFKWATYWGFKEYMDIYRRVWELNKSLPKSAPRFRVVHLNYIPRWDLMKEEMTAEDRKRVMHKGDGDEFMAKVVLKEIVDKGQKALIYSGQHHAFTRYRQPMYDFEKKKLLGLRDTRMGNIVQKRIPDKVFNIFLHFPWPMKENFDAMKYPVNGGIDAVMREFHDQRVGFDVVGSPFGKLRDNDAYYAIGYDNFTLSTFCDGYIFQMPVNQYQGCTVDTVFVTEGNLQEAIAWIPNVKARKHYKKPQDLIESMRDDVNMPRRLRDVK